MASVAALLVLLLAGALPAYATNYIVGDSSQWKLGVNYDNWVSGKTFKVGDTLLFQYSPSQHNVVEVSKTNYDSCSSSNAIKTYTDGNTSISLTATGSRYFICGFPGHCAGGMKVSVTVPSPGGSPTTPSPPSPSPPTGSTSPPPPPSNGPSSQPPPPSNGPSSQPPPPPPASSATGSRFFCMNALLLGALLMGVALLC